MKGVRQTCAKISLTSAVGCSLVLTASCGSEPPATDGLVPKEVRQVTWALPREADGRSIQVVAEYGGSTCTRFDRWEVDEAADAVEVRAYVEFELGACTDDLVGTPHTVELEEPLGDRPLSGCNPRNERADCSVVSPR